MRYSGWKRRGLGLGAWVGLTAGRVVARFFFSSRRRHTRLQGDWSSDVCSSDLSTYSTWPTCSTLRCRQVQGELVLAPGSQAPGGSYHCQGPSICPENAPACLPKIGRASCRERV